MLTRLSLDSLLKIDWATLKPGRLLLVTLHMRQQLALDTLRSICNEISILKSRRQSWKIP